MQALSLVLAHGLDLSRSLADLVMNSFLPVLVRKVFYGLSPRFPSPATPSTSPARLGGVPNGPACLWLDSSRVRVFLIYLTAGTTYVYNRTCTYTTPDTMDELGARARAQ